MADHNENVFESEICTYLESQGWLYSANDTGYDRERALFPEDLYAWLEETQQQCHSVKPLSGQVADSQVWSIITARIEAIGDHALDRWPLVQWSLGRE